jgi:hypothetical protein
MWLTQDLRTSYKCLISHFSPTNIDIIDYICDLKGSPKVKKFKRCCLNPVVDGAL